MSDIDYDPLSRKYLIRGQPKTKASAVQLLRADGLTRREASTILNIYRLSVEIEARQLPPPNDALTDEEAYRLMCALLGNGLSRAVSIHAARRYVAERLRPAKRPHPNGLRAWKHFYEWETHRYIRQGDFAAVLAEHGIRVDGDRAYAKELKR